MASVRGIISLKGSIDNFCFYKLNGKQIVRQKSGPSKERIMNDLSYKRLKENMFEFGGASQIAKVYRMSLQAECKRFGGPYISGRLNGLFKKVCNAGSGKRGKRSYEFSKNGSLLMGFQFSKLTTFERIFNSKTYMNFDQNTGGVCFNILPFHIKNVISSPKSATHFKIILTSSVLSDYVFDSKSGMYIALQTEFSGLSSVTESDAIDLKSNAELSVQLKNDLGNGFELPENACIISSVGIVFYQNVNGKVYELETGKAMRISAVF